MVPSSSQRDPELHLKALYKEIQKNEPELPSYEQLRKDGGYQYKKHIPYIAYEEEIRDPENHPFSTPSGKIEIFSKRLYDLNDPEHIPAIPGYIACPEGPEDTKRHQYPLQLIGWHTKRRTHSMHDNNPWMEEAEPQKLWIHPKDAAARGIADEDKVCVFNDRGAVEIIAFVTDRIIEGVCAMPQGAWYTPDKHGIDTRGSINVLTSTAFPSPVAKGNPQHTNLVEVRKA